MSSKKEFESIAFDLPKNQSNVIKVIGVGGGGSNAINHMFQQGIKGVDFYVCNTDAQALQNSSVPNKIQLGLNLTEGLGAGANPDIGEQSAVESFDDISTMLDSNTKMVFITAGMGGGTGTGAAPIIAKMAKEMDILTVGIVTMPFAFEGKMRIEQSQRGIEKLRNVVDSLIVINNNKLREVYGNLGFKAGFSKADEVLSTAARGIAEVITHHYTQNIDLRDAKTVLSDSGTAIMGSAIASGKSRAQDAISKALDSPLLNDNKITGAKNVLLLIVSGSHEITIDEIGEINDHIQTEAGHGANIIMGVGEDDSLEESIAVTIIATGFDVEQQDEISNTETKKVVHTLGVEEDVSLKRKRPVAAVKPIKEAPVVRHTLDLDEEQPTMQIKKKFVKQELADTISNAPDLITTSENIKNIDVIYKELRVKKVVETKKVKEADTEDFIIKPVTRRSSPVENDEDDASPNYYEDEKQITLTFDLPLSQNTTEDAVEDDVISHQLNEAAKDVSVNEHIELIPVNETTKKGDIRYVLDDYVEVESGMNKKASKPSSDVLEDFDDDIVFEKKILKTDIVEVSQAEEINPMDVPISHLLKERANERRRNMRDFNYRFGGNKSDDIEKVPAYKRQGVNLEDAKHSSELDRSRTSITSDDNDEIQLRNNNSFLHDNVD